MVYKRIGMQEKGNLAEIVNGLGEMCLRYLVSTLDVDGMD